MVAVLHDFGTFAFPSQRGRTLPVGYETSIGLLVVSLPEFFSVIFSAVCLNFLKREAVQRVPNRKMQIPNCDKNESLFPSW